MKAKRKQAPQNHSKSQIQVKRLAGQMARKLAQPKGENHENEAGDKPAAPKSNWVSITREDVLRLLTLEQRKGLWDWEKAISCPESEVHKLTPEQKAQRERYRTEKWPLYDAACKKFRETDPNAETRNAQAITTLHDFMEFEEWLARNTPHPFRVSHWSYIPNVASLACRYLRKMARYGNENAVEQLAQIAVEIVETMTDLLSGESDEAKRNAEIMSREASGLPYWPMLQFLNTAANNHFPRIADKLGLGRECPVNVAATANYSLETPINRFVWRQLRHFQSVHRHVSRALKGWGEPDDSDKAKTFEEAIGPLVFRKVESPPARRPFTAGMVRSEEIPVYKASILLPPLTKSTAKEWADVAIMARLDAIGFDYLNAPEFGRIRKRRRVKSRATARAEVRKGIIQSLQSLARPVSPNPTPS